MRYQTKIEYITDLEAEINKLLIRYEGACEEEKSRVTPTIDYWVQHYKDLTGNNFTTRQEYEYKSPLIVMLEEEE